MISNMVLDQKLGRIRPSMRDSIRMEKDMDSALFILLIGPNMLESFIRIRFKAKEVTYGKMDVNSMDFGEIVK